MVYAIIESGGQQHRVAIGECITVNAVAGEVGSEIVFPNVLLYKQNGTCILGTPYVDKFTVTGKIVAHARQPKVIVFKYKRRKNHKKTKGCKQPYTEVEITSIAEKQGK